MNNQMENKIRQDSKRQNRYRKMYRRGERWRNFGKHGFLMVDHESMLRTLGGMTVRCAIMLTLWLVLESFGKGYLVYAGLHLMFLLLGAILMKVFSKKLDALQEEYTQLREDYYRFMCQHFGIVDNCIAYDNGVVVGNGSVAAAMRQSVGHLRIYQLGSEAEKLDYKDYKKSLPKGTVTINEYIASLEFRNKFYLKTQGGTDQSWLRYLTPTLQLGMVRTPDIAKFKELEICNDRIWAKTDMRVTYPMSVNLYEKRALMDYFTAVDSYCQEMRQKADEVHKRFEKIDFLRGA